MPVFVPDIELCSDVSYLDDTDKAAKNTIDKHIKGHIVLQGGQRGEEIMLVSALNRTWQQLLHPKFRSVFLMGVLSAAISLGLLVAGTYYLWPQEYSSGFDWLDTAGFTLIALAASYILFPAISTIVMSMLADQVADAVEEKFYPHRTAKRDVPLGEVLSGATKLMMMTLLLNLVALVPYVILFFTTGGLGTFALYIALNGYLLGREYWELVALRHYSLQGVKDTRRANRDSVFTGGAVIAGIYSIPIVNVLAPIIGASVMTHIFHQLADSE